jgi:hypothetical protein
MMDASLFNESLKAVVLDAIPSPLLVLDSDARIHGMNKAASDFIGPAAASGLRHRCGEVFRCIHQHQSQRACGQTEACGDCIIRLGLQVISGGPAVVRQRYDMKLLRGEQCEPVVFWVTASAMKLKQETMALVVLEDISELVVLRDLVPICASCKKVRTGDSYWEQVEAYMSRHLDLTFTHGICPECVEKFYGELGKTTGEEEA